MKFILYSLNLFVICTNAYWFKKSIDEPYVTLFKEYTVGDLHNFVYSDKYYDELTDKIETIYRRCESPYPLEYYSPRTDHWIDIGSSASIDYFNWKCVEKADGKLSLEPVSCFFNTTTKELNVGKSEWMGNGSVKHSCEFADGGLKGVVEYVPGCYYDGKVHKVGEKWIEKNPGDHETSPYVIMECYRSESGYFDKKVTGCVYETEVWNTGEVVNMTINLNYVEETFYVDEDEYQERKNRKEKKCIQTEPGHVSIIEVGLDDMACVYKNETHGYKSSWIDKEIDAELYCSDANRVVKTNCVIRGRYYSTSVSKYRLSNGCTFICDEQKHIFKCPNLLPNLKTRVPAGRKD